MPRKLRGRSRRTAQLILNVRAGGEWSMSCPSRFTPGRDTRHPLYSRLSGTQGRFGRVWKIDFLSAPELEPQTVQHVASRYTHYATAPEPQTKGCSKSRGIWQWMIRKAPLIENWLPGFYSSLFHQAAVPITDSESSAIKCLRLVDLLRRYS